MIGKLIWNIISKNDLLWVKWVYYYYFKGYLIWMYFFLLDVIWVWRKLCKFSILFIVVYNGEWWIKVSFGICFIKIGYKWLVIIIEKVYWYKWVWNNFNIFKYNMICWMMVLDKFKIKDRLYNLGICLNDLCVVCGSGKEIREYLFYEC